MITVLNGYNFIEKDSAVAIGKFDGMHIGHEVILKRLAELKAKGLTTILLSFDPSPDVFFWRMEDTVLLSKTEMEERLASCGIDYHIILSFGRDLAQMSPEEFLSEILLKKLRVKEIVAGEDVSFGYKGRGNAAFLKDAEKAGLVKCHILKKLTVDGEEVSSTSIRKYLSEGKIEKANEFLGYRYSYTGVIEEGKHLGRTYGFPTVNFYPEKKKLLPPMGVYFSIVRVKERVSSVKELADSALQITNTEQGTGKPDMNGQRGKVYYAMTNIGLRPSVEEKKGVNLESYLFGNPGNLYGETCTVSLYHFHRPEQKFESIDRLVEQLKQDRAYCAEYFSIRE